ncbi:hypothetical protein [Rhizobium terricola]|uniref:hypothetical protein n=1 Tax=Rhizobium terricola TaxID=2728849 RepID=UPI001FEDF7B3|nr:hypothetical protein [Rhizobium terricola]
MADQSQELLFEILRKLQSDMSILKDGQRETRQEINSLRNYMHLIQGDMNNLRGTMSQMLDRLDRIENRLELRELAEAQSKV